MTFSGSSKDNPGLLALFADSFANSPLWYSETGFLFGKKKKKIELLTNSRMTGEKNVYGM